MRQSQSHYHFHGHHPQDSLHTHSCITPKITNISVHLHNDRYHTSWYCGSIRLRIWLINKLLTNFRPVFSQSIVNLKKSPSCDIYQKPLLACSLVWHAMVKNIFANTSTGVVPFLNKFMRWHCGFKTFVLKTMKDCSGISPVRQFQPW